MVQSFEDAKILIVDDERPNLILLEQLLRRSGFKDLAVTGDSRKAIPLFQEFKPDLILLDLHMPYLDGFAVMEQLLPFIGSEEYLPIVILTADVTMDTKRRALTAGATDFLTKPFDRFEVVLRIRNVLQTRLTHLKVQEQNATLEENVRSRTIALEKALAELKGVQQQVIQQERLAALGTMAGGIAHDFNNALSIIMGYGECLLRDADHGLKKEDAVGPLQTILTAADDASRIVHRLREFYRPDGESEPHVPLNLNTLVEQALTLTKPRWLTQPQASGRAIQMALELSEIGEIAGNAAEIREVLMNLIFNAVDAMPTGGTITISTLAEADSVVLKIRDSGTGMSEEVRQRCLEPFFTTKGKRGTGLGLAMVYGIVERHGGRIDLDSEIGVGTTFTFRFPVHAGTAEHIAPEQRKFEQLLHILVVEDQPILCDLLTDGLVADCHTVESALNGKQALEKFRNGRFDLVITDQSMPEMTGTELAAEIKKLSPRTPVILLTGYGEIRDSGCCDCLLGKPATHLDLRRAIARVMAPEIK